MMASSAISSRRFLRMASFTRWSCRRLSLSPRRRSSHGKARRLLLSWLLCTILLLPRQQATDVFEEFVSTLRTIVLPCHQRFDHLVELAELLHIRTARRNGQLDRVASLLKELFLNGLFELFVHRVVELLAAPVRHSHLAEDLVAEALFAVLGHLYLLFNGAHERFVGWHFFPGDGIEELVLTEVGLHIIQVIVHQGESFLFEGDKERLLHIGAGNLIVFSPRLGNQIGIALPVGFFEL